MMINGNVSIPHQYTFAMNPEGNPALPLATINANINVGGAASVDLGTQSVPLTELITYATTVNTTADDISIIGSNVSVTGSNSYVQLDITNPGVEVVSQSGNVGISAAGLINNTASNFRVTSPNTSLSADSVFSVSTNQGSINLNAASNVNINSSGSNVNIESYYITNVKGSDVNVVADTGLSAFNTPIVNITAQNGPLGGLVNIESFASYGQVAGYGRVSINAHGSENNPVTPIGGSIDINAYSAGVGDYGGATSAIRLNAATIGINAGALPPFLSLAGSAVIFGNNIVSICAGAPAIFPQIPLTTYIYGTAGLRLDCGTGARVTSLGILQAPNVELDIIRANSNAGLGVYFADPITANVITPQPSFFVPNGGGDLYIRGSNTIFHNSYVQLQDIGSLTFATALASNVTGAITGLSTINGQGVGAFGGSSWSLYNQISSLSSITADVGVLSTLNVSSINGLQIAQPWYEVTPPLLSTAFNFGGNDLSNVSSLYTTILRTNRISDFSPSGPSLDITNLSSVNGVEYVPTQDWSLYPATSGIDADGNNVGNVGTVFANNLNLTNDFTMTNNDSTANFNNNALTNVSSINGYQFPVPIAPAGSISVSTIAVSSIQAIFGTTVNMAGVTINQLNGLFTNSINTPVITGTGYSGPLEIYDASGVILGGVSVPVSLIGLSSINGQAYPVTAQNADSLVVSTITVSSIGAVSGGVVNMNGVIINQLNGVFSSNVNTPILTNVGVVGTPLSIYDNDGVIIGAATGPVSLINLSSINGVAYPTAAGWNGNATTNLNMNFNDITTVQNMNTNTLVCVGQVSASNFTTASVAVNTASVTIGSTTLDGGGLGATGVSVSYANVSGNVSAASLTNVITVNGVKTYCAPNVNQYITSGVIGITYVAVSPGTVNIQSATPTAGGDLGVVFQIRDADNIPGEYRFCNANAVNNMRVQFQTVDPYGNYPNWGGNNQLSPGESILCRCWYNNYQGRYVITNIQKDGNP
jgi:hypothetical protein